MDFVGSSASGAGCPSLRRSLLLATGCCLLRSASSALGALAASATAAAAATQTPNGNSLHQHSSGATSTQSSQLNPQGETEASTTVTPATQSSHTTTQAAAAAAAAATAGLSAENGPILYTEPNRTSAIDDIRSVVLYIFIITIFFSFFLILPGIRNEKFPTFLCITTSLIVVSIILISLFGTSWHVAEAPISSAYKAFSRDRIQGELSVSIGLQSVNITLRAHKYYIHHDQQGPMIMYNIKLGEREPSQAPAKVQGEEKEEEGLEFGPAGEGERPRNLADELTAGRSADGTAIDTELEVEEVFPEGSPAGANRLSRRQTPTSNSSASLLKKRNILPRENTHKQASPPKRKYSVERLNVDINYNERFYFIGPEQMRQEHHSALERGLPYPILTVVEYLSQDEAGFSWSRQYRAAGYYSHIMLWLSLFLSALMFIFHCAAPKYGIYTMQLLGCLLLTTNLTYATLVPKAERKLVIPFEGQSLAFQFGWNFWALSIGGCLSLLVGTTIVIIDWAFPNFIFTTILDVDFDSHHNYYRHRPKADWPGRKLAIRSSAERPARAPFFLERQKTEEDSGRQQVAQMAGGSTTDTATSVISSAASAISSKLHSDERNLIRATGGELSSDSEIGASSSTRRRISLVRLSQEEKRRLEDGDLLAGQEDHYRNPRSAAGKKANLKRTHQQTPPESGSIFRRPLEEHAGQLSHL